MGVSDIDLSRLRRVLVIRSDNIGDVLCTTPAITALRSRLPNAYIAALVCTRSAEAISGHPAIDELFHYPKASHTPTRPLSAHLELAKVLVKLRMKRFDLALAMRGNFSPSLGWLAFASGARWRLGPRPAAHQARWGFFLNVPVGPPPRHLHEVERNFFLLKHIQVDTTEKKLYLHLPEPAQQAAEAFLQHAGLARPVALHLWSAPYSPGRRWPAYAYAALASRIKRMGLEVVLTHGPGDEALGKAVAEAAGGLKVFCAASLKVFGALVARCRAVVCVEGGVMHVAAAVGTPVVVLWDHADPREWAPWGVEHIGVGGGGAVERVHPAEVAEALERLLAITEEHRCSGR